MGLLKVNQRTKLVLLQEPKIAIFQTVNIKV